MLPGHDASGRTPTSIFIADDAISSPAAEDYYKHTRVAKQPHYSPHYSTGPVKANYSYPSSPETHTSMSGSSTGSYSYSVPPQSPQRSGHWDSAVAMASSPLPPSAAVLDAYADASRAEAGFITDHHKHGVNPLGQSWSAEGSLSDGGHGSARKSSRSFAGEIRDVPNTVTVYTTTDDKEGEQDREPNAVLILLLLSAPIPLFSICTSIYTLFAVLLVIFTSPLRLCPPTAFFRSTTFSKQLCQLLSPALRRHDRLAQSSTSYYCNHHLPSKSNPMDDFSAPGLILVLTLAPFLCFGLLLAVWIAAFFWIFAMILGNPDGTERRDDGRAAVLGVNRWWQTWLRKGRKSL